SDNQHMQFFVSTTQSFSEEMDWTYKGYTDWSVPNGVYQNAYFITECGTGQLYWLAFMQQDDPRGDSWADLYKVREEDGKLNVDFIHNERLAESDDACEAKGGAGAYVTPLGGLVIYCSQIRSVEKNRTDQDPELLNFAEFAAPHRPSCGQGFIHAAEFCGHDPDDQGVLR
ncbi:MAG: hypothetical protein AAFQ99_09890, partial [Pseudomonadota bacterium]